MAQCCSIITGLLQHPTISRVFTSIYILTLVILNPLPAGAAYIQVFIFYYHIKYQLLNMLKIKCDNNQQYLQTVDLHFSNLNNCHTLEVVDRVSETQLQVGENSD